MPSPVPAGQIIHNLFFSSRILHAQIGCARAILQAILMRQKTAVLMPFPNIDPIIFEIGPFALRWYAVWPVLFLDEIYGRADQTPAWPQGVLANEEQIDDLLLWVTLGVIVGGRLGYARFTMRPIISPIRAAWPFGKAVWRFTAARWGSFGGDLFCP